MADTSQTLTGPDFTQGVAFASVADNTPLLGHVGDEPVIVVRCGDQVFAVGATCTHYNGPLAEGLVVGDTVRCPWHHACFSLRTGEAVRPPALNPVSSWRVERREGKVYVRDKLPPTQPNAAKIAHNPSSVVIVGGGAAAEVAAETLRREGYAGPVTMLSADEAAPCDRPNLSKDYLAGTAPEDWISLRSLEFYKEHEIELRLGARVTAIDPAGRQVRLADGSRCAYDTLLLATGADPVRLPIPGAELPHVHYLRSLADSRALIAKVRDVRRVVVIGASFIGLEVAAALRHRDLEVPVIAPEARPLERVLGPEIGDFIRALHEEHGVVFHLGTVPTRIDAGIVSLKTGETLPADLVVIGVGVRPGLDLAQNAGLAVDRGIAVNEYLETSVPGIFAAGDVARWPDPHTGERIRIEHWVVAQRQGQTAARNILGRRERFAAVPFFWSQHYDLVVSYVGHAESWDAIEIDGNVKAKDCTAIYRRGGRKLAVATIFRDLASLRAEVEFERADRR